MVVADEAVVAVMVAEVVVVVVMAVVATVILVLVAVVSKTRFSQTTKFSCKVFPQTPQKRISHSSLAPLVLSRWTEKRTNRRSLSIRTR